MYAEMRPMNMAVMAMSPKPAMPDFFPPSADWLPLSFFVYFFVKNVAKTMPHMMQTLMSRAMVLKAFAVMAAPDRWPMPTAWAAASATDVS